VDDHARLALLVQELARDPAYATGRRSFPRTVTPEDAIAIAAALQAEVDKGVGARAAAAARQGMTMACGRGCAWCCEEPVMIYRPEAVRVARWLAAPEQAEACAAFRAALPAWRERVGDLSARLGELTARGDAEAYRAAHMEAWRTRAMCALNQGGDCLVYPVRPIVCRNAHATGTAAHCRIDAPDRAPVSRLTFAGLDGFVARARGILRAAHNALGGPRGRPEEICDVVAALIG
jgi:hypothetical protein